MPKEKQQVLKRKKDEQVSLLSLKKQKVKNSEMVYNNLSVKYLLSEARKVRKVLRKLVHNGGEEFPIIDCQACE